MLSEVLRDIDIGSGEACLRRTPGRCIWIGTVDVRRHIRASEAPSLDVCVCPFHGDNSAAVVVETVTDRIHSCVSRSASNIVGVARAKSCVTVCLFNPTTLWFVGIDHAWAVGMQSSKVCGSVVDALDDIDLAVVWPRRSTKSPEGRPRTTNASWHMFEITDPQTLGVRIFGFDTDTGSSVCVIVVAVVVLGRTIVRVERR